MLRWYIFISYGYPVGLMYELFAPLPFELFVLPVLPVVPLLPSAPIPYIVFNASFLLSTSY
uniref:Uncharacterized protein n=1 Tax=Podoviridae sp. ctsNK10 TaxID=2826582 RepID=A0A8S5NKK7_9CAUD|nr:MAG TPA: hypothetical protein [Podoviridae sp. ctsNK10]